MTISWSGVGEGDDDEFGPGRYPGQEEIRGSSPGQDDHSGVRDLNHERSTKRTTARDCEKLEERFADTPVRRGENREADESLERGGEHRKECLLNMHAIY
jgi:hypothetical protein